MSKEKVEKYFGDRLRIRVCGLCLDDQGRLLLTEHAGLGPEGHLWLPPGGGMTFGESARDCLVREIKEETGLQARAGDFLFVHEYLAPPLHAVEFFFEAVITGGKLKTGRDPELADDEQIILTSAFLGEKEIKGISPARRHGILKNHTSPKDIIGLRGYFRIH